MAEINIPKKLKIGGHIYSIIYSDHEDIDGDCGQSNRSRNTIKIRNDLPKSQQQETLLHEILHAINYDLSEETVDFLSMALYAILVDNNLLK